MKRYAVLITFAPGVSEKQANDALDTIKALPAVHKDAWRGLDGSWRSTPVVNEYNDEHGSPVFYIP